jgi:hypothetical protein
MLLWTRGLSLSERIWRAKSVQIMLGFVSIVKHSIRKISIIGIIIKDQSCV